jgi:hypothetical protein
MSQTDLSFAKFPAIEKKFFCEISTPLSNTEGGFWSGSIHPNSELNNSRWFASLVPVEASKDLSHVRRTTFARALSIL